MSFFSGSGIFVIGSKFERLSIRGIQKTAPKVGAFRLAAIKLAENSVPRQLDLVALKELCTKPRQRPSSLQNFYANLDGLTFIGTPKETYLNSHAVLVVFGISQGLFILHCVFQ